jgi:hypothetical protein
VIAKGKFVKGNLSEKRSKLNRHLKYIEHRLDEHIKYMEHRQGRERRQERYLFGKDSDHLTRKEALDDIMQHATSRVAYHKIVLSPSKEEPVKDWRAWTRAVMHDLEQYQGKSLHWYAVIHKNTSHPHVHLVLAGVGELQDGRKAAVYMNTKGQSHKGKDDYGLLRTSGREHSEYAFYQSLQQTIQEWNDNDTTTNQPGKEVEQTR